MMGNMVGSDLERWCRNEFRKMFGRRLQDALNEKNMSQTDFAKKTRMSLSTINHYIMGNAMPSAYSVYKFAIVLKKPIEYFYG